MQRSELISAIQAIEPTFDPSSRSDSYLAGYLGTLNATRTDAAPQTAQRCEARDARIDSATSVDGDPAELARDRMLKKRADAAKRTGLPDFTSNDPEAAAPPVKREDVDEDPDAARNRALARRADAATKTGFPWQT